MRWEPTVYELSRRDLLRSKKMAFAVVVSVIPVLLAVLAYADMAIQAKTSIASYMPLTGPGLVTIGLMATIPLTALLLAGGSIADEAEERTLSYLLVRPIDRASLYLARTVAVVTVAASLAAAQALGAWIVDALAYSSFHVAGQTEYTFTGDARIDVGRILLVALPLSMAVSALAAAVYSMMFCAVSIIFTRYHAFANLVWFGIWEITLGITQLPTAWLSANHALRLLAAAVDPTLDPVSPVGGTQWAWVALPLTLAFVALWAAVGVRVMRRRDFHITSAAS